MPRLSIGPLSIEVPDLWTLSTVILAGPVTDQQPSTGMLRTPAVRPFQRNLVASMERVGPGVTAESYVRRQIEGLRAAEVARQEAREPEKVKLSGGLEGLITEQVILGAGGERVRQMQLVSIKDGVAYTLITSHLDGTPFEAVRQEFREMLLSFS
jgi:hypothetical protein